MTDFVPLLQTISWIALIGVLVAVFRGKLDPLFDALAYRFRHSKLKGPMGWEIGENIGDLPQVSPGGGPTVDDPKNGLNVITPADDFVRNSRESLYQDGRGIFVTHVVQPSTVEGQKFDIFIYLVRHRSNDFSDVERAEFYLGKHWGDKVFEVEPSPDERMGIRTAAYGTFLCTCRVVFRDGGFALTYRYIDFEMGSLLQAST